MSAINMSTLCQRLTWSPVKLTNNLFPPFSGLSVAPFQGLYNVQEVTCSGETLDSSMSLMSLTIYLVSDDKLLASMNIATGHCLTSTMLSACVFHATDSRLSKLKLLVLQAESGKSRLYGCNATAFMSGRSKILSWSLSVTSLGEYRDWCFFYRSPHRSFSKSLVLVFFFFSFLFFPFFFFECVRWAVFKGGWEYKGCCIDP